MIENNIKPAHCIIFIYNIKIKCDIYIMRYFIIKYIFKTTINFIQLYFYIYLL